jgi:hypothetical protein
VIEVKYTGIWNSWKESRGLCRSDLSEVKSEGRLSGKILDCVTQRSLALMGIS